ncbi:tyrosine-type recombinase/integrase [Arsenicibacter rosenii]|uniref:Tyr recombinase domain-containing protein n=1 Tax=Arsenicibacter rosenii TaxID=1750698 RepID=A0A1S2VAZ9_9BACT|nr:tyrosine-type recombinase/integrase [Arsenicibacter rosenii]OIN55839.1 hypothetical protein BLX24_27675 [Arsenicibacter rosenii]
MAISVRYRLRPPKKGQTYSNPHVLQCRITVNGTQDSGFSAVWKNEKIMVNPAKWKCDQQRTSQRDDPANELIDGHRSAIREVHRNQVARGWTPTKDSVKYEFIEGIEPELKPDGSFYFRAWDSSPKPVDRRISEESAITEALAAYYIQFCGNYAKERKERWQYVQRLLIRYLEETHQPDLPCYKVNAGWARRFHAWLQTIDTGRWKNRKISPAHASTMLYRIGSVLDWLVEEQLLISNPINSIKWPAYQQKEVIFLEQHHIDQVLAMQVRGANFSAHWWFKLMMLTGMDYPDAKLYAQNRQKYESPTLDGTGVIISGLRLKPPHVQYDIPKLPQVDALFAEVTGIPEPNSHQTLYSYLYTLQDMLGFEKRITMKTARKTAGVMFLYAGYTIAEVSRILGHKSISTTEKYYVKVTRRIVESGMKRVNNR